MYSVYLLYCDAALMHVYTHIYKALPVRYKCIYIYGGAPGGRAATHTSAYVSIRQHMSAYVSTCQHTSAYLGVGRAATRR